MPVIKQDEIENYIQNYVALILAELSGFEVGYISGEQSLFLDLGIRNSDKLELAPRFQEIINNLGGQKVILRSECRKLTRVSDCIDLVKSYPAKRPGSA